VPSGTVPDRELGANPERPSVPFHGACRRMLFVGRRARNRNWNPVPRCLYVCYFGLREPLVQTQVIAYLREIRDGGVDATLLTFEPADRTNVGWHTDWRNRLAAEGIRWLWLPYHSAAMTTLAKRMTGVPMLFDVRGLLAEEYVDAGLWRQGGINYRLTKRAERSMFDAADGFVVLTERARELFFPGATDTDRQGRPIEVIPCCVDLDRFAEAARRCAPRARSDWQARDRLCRRSRRVVPDRRAGGLSGDSARAGSHHILANPHAEPCQCPRSQTALFGRGDA
jgi:glycosyltransferase involved in cell wall biosynthesis